MSKDNEATGGVTRSARNSDPAAGEEESFDAELERRLNILESADYDDPARTDLPLLDYVLLAAIVVVTVVAMYWWGY